MLLSKKDIAYFKNNLESIGAYLVLELQKELEQQGRKASGLLIDSIEYKVFQIVDRFEMHITMLNHGLFAEKGVAADKVPYGRKTGKKISQYIQGLINWIKIKQLTNGNEKAIKGFAFAIAKTHKKRTWNKYGNPSKGSFKYSKNGRRIGFLSHVLNTNEKKIEDDIFEGVGQSVDLMITDLFNKIAKQVR